MYHLPAITLKIKLHPVLVAVDSKSPVVTLKSFSNEPSSILNTPNLAPNASLPSCAGILDPLI